MYVLYLVSAESHDGSMAVQFTIYVHAPDYTTIVIHIYTHTLVFKHILSLVLIRHIYVISPRS